jgi:hypothetical protein
VIDINVLQLDSTVHHIRIVILGHLTYMYVVRHDIGRLMSISFNIGCLMSISH